MFTAGNHGPRGTALETDGDTTRRSVMLEFGRCALRRCVAVGSDQADGIPPILATSAKRSIGFSTAWRSTAT